MDHHQPGARLIRRHRVGPALLIALLAASTTAVLGWFVDGGSSPNRLDRFIEGVVDTVAPMGDGVPRLLGEAVADLGSPPVVAVLLIVVCVLAYRVRGSRGLALALVGPVIAMLTTSTVLKPIIGRTRGETLAYPSGHTTAATSIAVVVAILALCSALRPARRRAALALLAVTVLGVCAAQVGREYHYGTDTVGAVGVAVAVVLLVAVAIDAMADSMAVAPGEVIGRRPADAARPDTAAR